MQRFNWKLFGKSITIILAVAMLFTMGRVQMTAAGDNPNQGNPPKAELAIAVQLKEEGIEARGPHISTVAQKMEPGTTFEGVSKWDADEYRDKVEEFLIGEGALSGSDTTDFTALSPVSCKEVDVLIGFDEEPNPGLVRAFEDNIYREFDIVDVIAATMSEQAAEALAGHPNVSYVEPDGKVYTLDEPSEQLAPWGIDGVIFSSIKFIFLITLRNRGDADKVHLTVTDTEGHETTETKNI